MSDCALARVSYTMAGTVAVSALVSGWGGVFTAGVP